MGRSRLRRRILAVGTGCTTLAVTLSRFGLEPSPIHAVLIGAGAALSALGLWNVFTARIE